jgi:hypothetical protein
MQTIQELLYWDAVELFLSVGAATGSSNFSLSTNTIDEHFFLSLESFEDRSSSPSGFLFGMACVRQSTFHIIQ